MAFQGMKEVEGILFIPVFVMSMGDHENCAKLVARAVEI